MASALFPPPKLKHKVQLFIAVEKNHEDLVVTLVRARAKVDMPLKNGSTVLCMAIENKKLLRRASLIL